MSILRFLLEPDSAVFPDVVVEGSGYEGFELVVPANQLVGNVLEASEFSASGINERSLLITTRW